MRWPVVVFALAGCGRIGFDPLGGGVGSGQAASFLAGLPEATLTADPVAAKLWAGYSAPASFSFSYTLDALAGIASQNAPCPIKTTTPTGYAGGCTDANGNVWHGTAASVGDQTTGGYISYDNFGYTGSKACAMAMIPTDLTQIGTVTFDLAATNSLDFTIDLVVTSTKIDSVTCAVTDLTTGLEYTGLEVPGTRDDNADGKIDDSTWSGNGTAGDSANGVVSMHTDGEVVDTVVCNGEANSGSTTVVAGTHTLVFTYDGATKCDTTSTVPWTFDGVAEAELTGVQCGAAPGGAGGGVLVAFAIVLARRRRR